MTPPTIRPSTMPTVEGSNLGKEVAYRRKELWVENGRDLFYQQGTAGTLPDVILLEIFDSYFGEVYGVDDWHTLVHVCRRWRNVVFSSPRRLDLQLYCGPGRSVTEMLNIWPELPIYVVYDDFPSPVVEDLDNATAALKLKGSISRINLTVTSGSVVWDKFAAVMQDPFPMLQDLDIWSCDDVIPVISDSFLGGSAPRLQRLSLSAIVIPALPNLLLSATNLVYLGLWDIPHSAYISPEAIVTCFSVLTRLKSLYLRFRSPQSCPGRAGRFLPQLTRTLLPALTDLEFKGVTEYLEDLVARIDVPSLKRINIRFFNRLVFDIVHFPNLICHMEKFRVLDQADVVLNSYSIEIRLSPKGGSVNDSTKLELEIRCREIDWQLSALAQVCNLCLPTLSNLERLSICESQYQPLDRQDEAHDVENTQWLELLHPFATVKDLYLSQEVALRVASALQELSEERVSVVLPALQDIFIDDLQPSGLVQEGFHKFVTTRGRQISSLPVAIHRWIREEGK